MPTFPLLPDEKPLLTANNEVLTLTSHRLWYEAQSGSDAELRAIMLEDLCYCGLVRQEKLLWLVLAILSVAIGVLIAISGRQGGSALIISLLLGALFWFIYKASKKQTMDLASAAGKISVLLQSEDLAVGRQFVSAVLRAKDKWRDHWRNDANTQPR